MSDSIKEALYGKTPAELSAVVERLGLPRYAATQIAAWLYKKGAPPIDAMTDLSLRGRERLAQEFVTGLQAPLSVAASQDGTKKYLFPAANGAFVESAYIPDGKRATLCISTQAGCRMGCRFCMTARQGLRGSLSACDILNQFTSLPEHDLLTNIVYMGMGEPLDNTDQVLRSLEILTAPWGYAWSPTRITLSTVGVLPSLERFLLQSAVHLAVSLHNPFPDERAAIMPAERAWPIREVVALLRQFDFTHQRRVSFEYILMEGMNDTPAHVRELTRLLAGLKCRINLIRFHRIPDSPYASPPLSEMERFRDALSARGITTTIRASRGEDIQAACGLLSTQRTGTISACPNTSINTEEGGNIYNK